MSRSFDQSITGNVVSMERFRDDEILSPNHRIEAYWSALRTDTNTDTNTGGDIPKRSQIDPRGLGDILTYTFIIEHIAPGTARFRLAGGHLRDLAGTELRGMPLSMFFTPAARAQIGAAVHCLFDTPSLVEMRLTSEQKRNRDTVGARMTLLPLENDFGQVTRALGVLVADREAKSDAPLRFDLADIAMRPVNADIVETQPVAGFAETQEPLKGAAPYLRLVK